MVISLIITTIGVLLLLNQLIIQKSNKNHPKKNTKEEPKICILIPARDESKVIKELLVSIKNQTYKINMKDVYVIVEDINDKTVDITNKLDGSIVVRQHPDLKRKGYALDEAIKQIEEKYDLYFIFDADNILDERYIENMLKSYYKGYDLAIGYRNTKNGNDNIIATCSSLTFSMINQLFNDSKVKDTINITISGTGFFIRGEFIEKWGGYPFHTLTEDYELTLYSILNNMTSDYNKDAIFYDEQPTNMKTSMIQRTRWVKGFFEARKKYIPKIKKSLNKKSNNDASKRNAIHMIRSIITIVIGLVLYLSVSLYNAINILITKNIFFNQYLFNIIILLLSVYIVLVLLTVLIISKEEQKLNLNNKNKIKAIFYNPIFLFTYVICIIKMFINKDIGWNKIEHNNNKITT